MAFPNDDLVNYLIGPFEVFGQVMKCPRQASYLWFYGLLSKLIGITDCLFDGRNVRFHG